MYLFRSATDGDRHVPRLGSQPKLSDQIAAQLGRESELETDGAPGDHATGRLLSQVKEVGDIVGKSLHRGVGVASKHSLEVPTQ